VPQKKTDFFISVGSRSEGFNCSFRGRVQRSNCLFSALFCFGIGCLSICLVEFTILSLFWSHFNFWKM